MGGRGGDPRAESALGRGTLLIFATAPAITRAALAGLRPVGEVCELVVVFGTARRRGFPLRRRGRGDPTAVLSRSL